MSELMGREEVKSDFCFCFFLIFGFVFFSSKLPAQPEMTKRMTLRYASHSKPNLRKRGREREREREFTKHLFTFLIC